MPVSDNSLYPRKPTRSNGVEKYNLLVDAAARLVLERGVDALSIQNVADIAKTPKASVYHFFPTPDALAVALAESVFENFGRAVDRAARRTQGDETAQAFIVETLRETATFYGSSKLARTLFLGSSYSWAIRLTDVRRSAALAEKIAIALQARGVVAPTAALVDLAIVSIAIADSVWSLSVAETGEITPARQQEAERAVCGYLQAAGALPHQALLD